MSAATLLLALATACAGGAASGSDGAGAETASTVAVSGTDGLAFEPGALTASSGEVTIELTAGDAVNHTVVVEGQNDDAPVVEAAAGGSATGTIALEPGRYTYYCSVPGHREAGMEGTLSVA